MLRDYYEKIVNWSKERKIIPNAKVLVQAGKMISEKSEISKAFIDESYEELIDGIGDTFVTIVNVVELCKLKGIKDSICFNIKEPDCDISYALLYLDVLAGEVIDKIIKEDYDVITLLNDMLMYLSVIAKESNTTLEECVKHAYKQIKDRKGITLENGTFIKESDPRYREIIKKLNN